MQNSKQKRCSFTLRDGPFNFQGEGLWFYSSSNHGLDLLVSLRIFFALVYVPKVDFAELVSKLHIFSTTASTVTTVALLIGRKNIRELWIKVSVNIEKKSEIK
jgi:hypothetical protein